MYQLRVGPGKPTTSAPGKRELASKVSVTFGGNFATTVAPADDAAEKPRGQSLAVPC